MPSPPRWHRFLRFFDFLAFRFWSFGFWLLAFLPFCRFLHFLAKRTRRHPACTNNSNILTAPDLDAKLIEMRQKLTALLLEHCDLNLDTIFLQETIDFSRDLKDRVCEEVIEAEDKARSERKQTDRGTTLGTNVKPSNYRHNVCCGSPTDWPIPNCSQTLQRYAPLRAAGLSLEIGGRVTKELVTVGNCLL